MKKNLLFIFTFFVFLFQGKGQSIQTAIHYDWNASTSQWDITSKIIKTTSLDQKQVTLHDSVFDGIHYALRTLQKIYNRQISPLLIDSMVIEANYGEVLKPTFWQSYSYDKNNSLQEINGYTELPPFPKVLSSKTVFAYDANGYTYLFYQVDNSIAGKSDSIVGRVNENNDTVKDICYHWSDSASAWIKHFTDSYTFEGRNQVGLVQKQYYLNGSENYAYGYRDTCTFNSNNQLTQRLTYGWDIPTGNWMIRTRETDTYGPDGLVQVLTEINTGNSPNLRTSEAAAVYTNKSRTEYTYEKVTGVYSPSATIFSVFPNPASEFIQINSDAMVKGEITISIVTLTGDLVLVRNQSMADRYAVVPLDAVKAGVYFVEITTNEGVQKMKFVKK